MRDPLTDYIHTHAPHLADNVTDDTQLLAEGLLDSMSLMKLVAFLERRHNLIVPDEAITPENFSSLAAIRKLIDGLNGTI